MSALRPLWGVTRTSSQRLTCVPARIWRRACRQRVIEEGWHHRGREPRRALLIEHTVDRDDGSSSPAGRPLNAFFRAWATPTATKPPLPAPNAWPFLAHPQPPIPISNPLSA